MPNQKMEWTLILIKSTISIKALKSLEALTEMRSFFTMLYEEFVPNLAIKIRNFEELKKIDF